MLRLLPHWLTENIDASNGITMMEHMNNTWLGSAIRKGVILTALPYVFLSGLFATGGDKMELTQDLIRELFSYRDDGVLFWNKSISSRSVAGAEAGSMKLDGYLKIGIYGKKHKRSRLNFMYHFGYMPNCVDHINGDTTDDRIENLRDASRGINSYNKSKMCNNSSGKSGVTFFTRLGTWRARINVCGKEHSLGYYASFQEAVEARKAGELAHYGEFARA